jgi:hypothetical protein
VHLALIKYSVMRMAIFVVSLIGLYAVGVRQSVLMLALALGISFALSYLLLRKQRDEVTRAIQERTSRHLDEKQARRGFGSADAEAEDAALDGTVADGAVADGAVADGTVVDGAVVAEGETNDRSERQTDAQ